MIHWDLGTGRGDPEDSRASVRSKRRDGQPRRPIVASGSGRTSDDQPHPADDNSVRCGIGERIGDPRLTLFSDSVTDVCFTPDGRQLAVATASDGFSDRYHDV
jgi:WD40 repeat protein